MAFLVWFLKWINQNAASAIQAFSAVVVALLTAFLVRLTRRYVQGTEKALAVSREQLQLLREQVEDQRRSIELARQEQEREVLEAHRQELNQKILEPLQLMLQKEFLEPTFRTEFGPQEYNQRASASEPPVIQGPILQTNKPTPNRDNSLDAALLEDAKQNHRNALIGDWEQFASRWWKHRDQRREWILDMSQRILDESKLPAFPSHGSDGYVMNLGLAVFVFNRLMKMGRTNLTVEQEYLSVATYLTDGEIRLADGKREQVTNVLSIIEALLVSQRDCASELRRAWRDLSTQRDELAGRFSYAIATKTLPERCPLVGIR